MEYYQVLKALHIIFVISWFAGLFYMVRLFIYHAEAQIKSEPAKEILSNQYKIMQSRLWFIISWPAMLLTILFGVLMFIANPGLLEARWMHVKITFLIILIAYHICCHIIFKKFKVGNITFSSTQLRIWNEVATLLMVIIVFIVMQKDATNWIKSAIGFLVVAVALMIGIKIYKKLRKS